MKYNDFRIRQKLERLIDDSPERPLPEQLTQELTNLCQTTVQWLRHDSSSPVVWTSRTKRSGEVLWNAYDPNSGWSIFCVPQSKVWAWLAQRYYSSPLGVHPHLRS